MVVQKTIRGFLSLTQASSLFLSVFLISNIALANVTDVCFSPKEHCALRLADFIDTSKKSVDIAVYSYNLSEVSEALIRAKKRNVSVRFVCDPEQVAFTEKNHLAVKNLIAAGIPVRFWQRPAGKKFGSMHNKFTLVDGERVQTGSFNYTANALLNNTENQIYINDADVAKEYQAEFELILSQSNDVMPEFKPKN